MGKFHDGQRVVCVCNEDYTESLDLYKCYTVLDSDRGYVQVDVDCAEYWWDEDLDD